MRPFSTRSRFLCVAAAGALASACGGGDAGEPAASVASADKLAAASPLERAVKPGGAARAEAADALFALMPEEIRPTYEAARFDEAKGALILEKLRIGGAPNGAAALADRAEIYGLDEAAIEEVAAGEGDDFVKLFDAARLFGVSITDLEEEIDGEIAFTIAAMEFDSLVAREGGTQDGPGAAAARFADAFRLGGLYLQDAEISASEGEEPYQIRASAADLRLVELGEGALGAAIAKNVAYAFSQPDNIEEALGEVEGPFGDILRGPLGVLLAPREQRTTIEALEWRGIEFSGLLEAALAGREPDVNERRLIDLGTLRAQNVESFVDDRRLAHFDEAALTAGEFTWLAPSNLRFEAKGGAYDLTAYVEDQESSAYALLKERGLDQVPASGEAQWRWDAKSGDASLTYDALADGFAGFQLETNIEGPTLTALAAAREARKARAGERDASDEAAPFFELSALESFSMRIEDEAALDAIFAIAALDLGGSGEDLRASLPAILRLGGAQMLGLEGRLADAVGEIADFVAEGGVLNISAAPDEPTPLGALAKPGAEGVGAPERLNLKIERVDAE